MPGIRRIEEPYQKGFWLGVKIRFRGNSAGGQSPAEDRNPSVRTELHHRPGAGITVGSPRDAIIQTIEPPAAILRSHVASVLPPRIAALPTSVLQPRWIGPYQNTGIVLQSGLSRPSNF